MAKIPRIKADKNPEYSVKVPFYKEQVIISSGSKIFLK